jgi:prevent-host-death family protein
MNKPPVWQLHDAKARFSELFRRARTEGPQRVVKQRGEAVVIVPAEDFDCAVEKGGQPDSLLEFFNPRRGADMYST